MTNEFGVKLDRNGYAPSVIDETKVCFLCKKRGDLARHEVFHGANRQKSKAYGAWVHLCPKCHQELHGKDPEIDKCLHTKGQIKVMEHYGWSVDDFRERFGKNYV